MLDELYRDGNSLDRSVNGAEDVELLIIATGGSCSAEIEVAFSKSSTLMMTMDLVHVSISPRIHLLKFIIQYEAGHSSGLEKFFRGSEKVDENEPLEIFNLRIPVLLKILGARLFLNHEYGNCSCAESSKCSEIIA